MQSTLRISHRVELGTTVTNTLKHSLPQLVDRHTRTGMLVGVIASRGLVGAAVVLSCTVAGCQSQNSSRSGPTSAGAGATHAAKRIDACSMLSPQDVSPLLGTTVPGKPTGSESDMGGCSWQNPTTEESVSVEIGNPGTALNNTLPPPGPGSPDGGTPGPDGMRFMGGGQVEFAAGNRSNTVQVAVLRLSADQANSAAVDLARKIAPQVPQ